MSFNGDAGLRGFISNAEWNQVIIRPGLRYTFNSIINLNASIAHLTTFNVNNQNVYELRVTTDVNIGWPTFEYFEFFHRFRMENRSFFLQNNPNENNWRSRYLIGLASSDIRAFREGRFYYFQLQFEPFQTWGAESRYELFVDQARFHLVLGHRVSQRFRYEAQYIFQGSRLSASNPINVSQHLIRLRFYHRWGQ